MSLIQTIESDLEAAGGWIDSEAETFAIDAWSAVKTLFSAVTAQQVTILKALVAQAQADETAGDGYETTVADVLTLATQRELAWVASIPGQALTALVALMAQITG